MGAILPVGNFHSPLLLFVCTAIGGTGGAGISSSGARAASCWVKPFPIIVRAGRQLVGEELTIMVDHGSVEDLLPVPDK